MDANDNFLKWGGSRTIAIPYNASEEELISLLRQINGAYFPGGSLLQVDFKTKAQHPFYQTASKIFAYSKYMKAVKKQEWPVLGHCQGLESIAMILNDGDPSVLDTVILEGINRPTHWVVPYTETRLWNKFNSTTAQRIEVEPMGLHFHTYSITIETFNRVKKMKEFMKITQTDTIEEDGKNVTFINSMEAYNYPIFAVMYHPEYQIANWGGSVPPAIVDNELTDEVAFRESFNLNRIARTNTNRPTISYNELYQNYGVSRVQLQTYPLNGTKKTLPAYGYQR
jgi:gamma-glutamyl hydrolase